ncbi:MAG: hypothetical protein II969_08215 [Anaerolineaceae bacterium]|nr:hypothetical protein [Anaerolineaceae bacterium]
MKPNADCFFADILLHMLKVDIKKRGSRKGTADEGICPESHGENRKSRRTEIPADGEAVPVSSPEGYKSLRNGEAMPLFRQDG